MANVVKCTSCGSYYNGAVYENCPYCSKGKAKPIPEENNSGEEKKSGIKLPFFPSRKTTEEKKYQTSEIPDISKPVTSDQFQKTEMLVSERNDSSVTQISNLPENRPSQTASGPSKPEKDVLPVQSSTSSPNLVAEPAVQSQGQTQGHMPQLAQAYNSSSLSSAISKSGRTVGKYISATSGESIAPVVGWIIGVKGDDYGRPYNLKSGKNRIGRSSDMDVCLTDESVSRSSVGVIAFDSKQKEFSLLPGESDSLCYLNGRAIYERQVLKYGDELEFGDCELNKYIFIPLCSDTFSWDKYPHSKEEA